MIQSRRLHQSLHQNEVNASEADVFLQKLLAAGHGSPASRGSVSRASLFFSSAAASTDVAADVRQVMCSQGYDDEEAGEMAIHYLARGEHRVGEGRRPAGSPLPLVMLIC